MAAQSSYQESPDRGDPATRGTSSSEVGRPRALWGVVAGMVIGVGLLVALPVVMIINRDHTIRAIIDDQPGLDPANLGFAFTAVIAFTVVVHGIDVILTIWFGMKALQGRQWARIALTVYLVVATVGSVFSAAAVPAYLWAVIPGDGIHILMLLLLWVPKSVRGFFAAHRSHNAA